MFGLEEKSVGNRCGAIIDIGSGSVGISLVYSEDSIPMAEVIWSHREYCLIKDGPTSQSVLREISMTLVNALLELNSEGRKYLKAYRNDLKIDEIQVSISAPWAYTIVKTVNLNDEHPFVVTPELLAQLEKAAKTQVSEHLSNDAIAKDLGLTMLSSKSIGARLNGYIIKHPLQQKGRSFSLSHLHAAAISNLIETLNDALQKITPHTPTTIFSFMFIYYCVLQHLKPDLSEVCLIDVTSEATEMGIVREGILQKVTSIDFGTYTLARNISVSCNISTEEAYSFLKDDIDTLEAKISKEMFSKISAEFDLYDEALGELFSQTGDDLSIPPTIFLHTDQKTEDLFTQRLVHASKKTTTLRHTVHQFTTELLAERELTDTALALSQRFFHIHGACFVDADKK